MITIKQKRILKAISKYIDEIGYSPTLREICEMTGLKSPSSAHSYISKLEEKGYIERKESSPRAIKLTNNGVKLIKSLEE